MKVYDIVRDVICDKTYSLCEEPSFEADFNPYMVARYLSMRPEYLSFAEWMNTHAKNLSKKAVYLYLTRHVPRSGNGRVEYIRRPRDMKKDDEDDE